MADGLYRIEWVYPQRGPRYRALFFATAAEHPLGVEWPNRIDPKLYDPARVADAWRDLDRREKELATAETVLLGITQWG